MENNTTHLKELDLDQLLSIWEETEHLDAPEVPTLRGRLMDEIERRNPSGFNAWLDQDAPEDKELRRFVTVNAICLDCAKWRGGCAGTYNAVWTGCIYRARRARGANYHQDPYRISWTAKEA